VAILRLEEAVLSDVKNLTEYLEAYGSALAAKAIHSMEPLHMPGRDPLPDFSRYLRQPYEAQGHTHLDVYKRQVLLQGRDLGRGPPHWPDPHTPSVQANPSAVPLRRAGETLRSRE